jgi:hypothetical protein
MNSAIILAGLLVGTPAAAPRSAALRPRISVGDARLLARFAADPSRFSPHFGRSDPGAHPVRFGASSPSSPAATARDAGLKDALHKPRATVSLQMSMPLK